MDAEVPAIIRDSHAEARRRLIEHRAALDALAEALLQRETLDEREILEVTGLPRAPSLETRKLPMPQPGFVHAPRITPTVTDEGMRNQAGTRSCGNSVDLTRVPKDKKRVASDKEA